MARIRTLIVDDEDLARDMLRTLLEDDAEIEVIGECRNGTEAVKAIESQHPDLVFLDVQMPDPDGFGVIQRVGVHQMPAVIFVTAFDHHAVQAFSVHALDYLVKPFDHQRFDDSLQRAKKALKKRGLDDLSERLMAFIGDLGGIPSDERPLAKKPIQATEFRRRIAIKAKDRIFFLNVKDIDWIEAAGDYVHLHVGKESHLIREKMSTLSATLDPQTFLRIHRSTIVNINSIKDIHPMFKGEYSVRLINGRELKLSRSYREKLHSFLNQKF